MLIIKRTVRNVLSAVKTKRTAKHDKFALMNDAYKRLQQARLKAGYREATDAARAFGWNENTYRSHENGTRGLKKTVAERYSKAFRVSPAWLLTGETDPKLRNIYPIYGRVGLGQEVSLVDSDVLTLPLEYIELPFGFSLDNIGALVAVGDSQHPRVKNGEVVIYARNDLPVHELVNRECIVKLMNGPVLLKTIRKGERNRFSLESHNAPMTQDAEIEWAGEVIAIIPSGHWKKLT